MAYTQKDMEGSLFKNEKREKENHPHMQGSCTIDGVKYWISAWTNDGDKGRWQGLKFKRAEEKPKKDIDAANAEAQQISKGRFDDMADDIPF
jgi:hypothetical protein